MPEPGAGAGRVLGPWNVSEQLERARWPLVVMTDLAQLDVATWRPGMLIRCDPRRVTFAAPPEIVPPWERVRRLLEEPDAG
jgi:hypothetical protein